MLPSWRLILPATHAFDLVMQALLGFLPPCLVGTVTSSSKGGPDPFCSLCWVCFPLMNCKVRAESGWFTRRVYGNYKHTNDTWPKEVFNGQANVKKCPWGVIFFPIMKLHGGRCGLSLGAFFKLDFIFILSFEWFFGVYSKKPLRYSLDGTQSCMTFFSMLYSSPDSSWTTPHGGADRLSSLQVIDSLELTLHWEVRCIVADLKSSSAWDSLSRGSVRAKVLH